MACFRLFHLSDLHIAVKENVLGGLDYLYQNQFPDSRVRWLEASSWNKGLGDAVLALAARNRSLLDAVLVSGDLATTGSDANLARAFGFITTLQTVVAWPSGPASDPASPDRRLILFPGNHDRFGWHLNLPGNQQFDTVFNRYWTPPRPPGQVQTTVLEKDGEELAIVQADFSLKRRHHAGLLSLNYLGQGKVYQEVLQELVQETRDQRTNPSTGQGRAIVWAIHFPPKFPTITEPLRLLDEENLLAEVQKLVQDLSLPHLDLFAGHTHSWRQYEPLANPFLRVYCAGTATQYCAPNDLLLGHNTIHPLEIDVVGGRVTRVRWYPLTWNELSSRFEPPIWDSARGQYYTRFTPPLPRPTGNWVW